ncbi:MAG TPA: hypothetical protein DER09_07725 [Prolixibacteraceae bacterium]|nr:hypothetical protein [Prolixibacteraceae bacterium]
MRSLFLLFFIFKIGLATGQNSDELKFINYLINKGDYKEALFLTEKSFSDFNPEQFDSLNYFKGWAHYSVKNLELSTLSLLNVSKSSPFYPKSRFFAGYNQIYLGNYAEAKEILIQTEVTEDPNLSLLTFELSGIEMLEGNWSEAKNRLSALNQNIALINQQIAILNKICEEQENHRQKSPVLAGIMSGIIPGSGKIYVGKTGEGIASLITNAGFGLITWENYRKLGINNFKTIFFGGIFIANYISNIYGTVISVKTIENEYQNKLHNQILFQLHIPLRNFFE